MSEIVVLIVDDDAAALRALVRALKLEADFTILTAGSREEAEEVVAVNRVDVTVIDGLYGDGAKLVEQLVATGLGGKLVAYSSNDEDQGAMIGAGCAVGLKKPFRLDDMMTLIRRLAASP